MQVPARPMAAASGNKQLMTEGRQSEGGPRPGRELPKPPPCKRESKGGGGALVGRQAHRVARGVLGAIGTDLGPPGPLGLSYASGWLQGQPVHVGEPRDGAAWHTAWSSFCKDTCLPTWPPEMTPKACSRSNEEGSLHMSPSTSPNLSPHHPTVPPRKPLVFLDFSAWDS